MRQNNLVAIIRLFARWDIAQDWIVYVNHYSMNNWRKCIYNFLFNTPHTKWCWTCMDCFMGWVAWWVDHADGAILYRHQFGNRRQRPVCFIKWYYIKPHILWYGITTCNMNLFYKSFVFNWTIEVAISDGLHHIKWGMLDHHQIKIINATVGTCSIARG